jgi:hypothetical protein
MPDGFSSFVRNNMQMKMLDKLAGRLVIIGSSFTFFTIIVNLLDSVFWPQWSVEATTASTVPVQLLLASPDIASAETYLFPEIHNLT